MALLDTCVVIDAGADLMQLIVGEERVFISAPTLGELSAADASFDDLERIISSDVGLSLKLLRYVNSAFFALPRNIVFYSVFAAFVLMLLRAVVVFVANMRRGYSVLERPEEFQKIED